MKKIVYFILIALIGYSCNQFNGNSEGSYQGATVVQGLGTVSVSTDGTFGTKNANKIERQLNREAKKLYPESTGIANIRYEGDRAYADVVK